MRRHLPRFASAAVVAAVLALDLTLFFLGDFFNQRTDVVSGPVDAAERRLEASAAVSVVLVALATALVVLRRRLPTPPLRTPLLDVLNETGNMPLPPRSWLLGWPLRILGPFLVFAAALPIVGSGLYVVFIREHFPFEIGEKPTLDLSAGAAFGGVLIATGVVLGFVGRRLWGFGKVNVHIAAGHAAVQDPRRPVLYLRPFEDDPVAGEPVHHSMWMVPTSHSEEEQLARAMSKIGPFVAIGEPGERLPQLGAIRVYVHDGAQWKETVTLLMRHSALVVLRAGFSPGFWWEAELAWRTLEPQRLVVLVGLSPDDYERFRDRASQALQVGLPPFPPSVRPRIAQLMQGKAWAALHFRADWTPEWLILAERRARRHAERSVRLLPEEAVAGR